MNAVMSLLFRAGIVCTALAGVIVLVLAVLWLFFKLLDWLKMSWWLLRDFCEYLCFRPQFIRWRKGTRKTNG